MAKFIRDCRNFLPARVVGWNFPDETIAELVLEDNKNKKNIFSLVFFYKAPDPMIYLSDKLLGGTPKNPFQMVLAQKAKGSLLNISQLNFDRVCKFDFSGERGFVNTEPTQLIFETTGRNSNLLLLRSGNFEGQIITLAREITNKHNRYRSLRTAGQYKPPPPYQKQNPFNISDDLKNVPLKDWYKYIDGLGKNLNIELCRRAGFQDEPRENFLKTKEFLLSIIDNPVFDKNILEYKSEKIEEKRQKLLKDLSNPLKKHINLLQNQLKDIDNAEKLLKNTDLDKENADILLYYANSLEIAETIEVLDFEGKKRIINLNPTLNIFENVNKIHERIKKRKESYRKLKERKPNLLNDLDETIKKLDLLNKMDLKQLQKLLKIENKQIKNFYGLQYTSPSGHLILVGRNNKENAFLTHKFAKSMHYWFHVQGYAGSHVIVLFAGNLNLPDIIFAAKLAAYYSKVKNSGSVAVDYTRIKYVWRQKNKPIGMVNYTNQKTVFVEGTL